MKRPLLFLFLLTVAAIALWLPGDYEPDEIFPQGDYYDVTVQGRLCSLTQKEDSLTLILQDCRILYDSEVYSCRRLLLSVPDHTGFDTETCQAGNLLTASGSLSSFEPARNPGNFDWQAYYLARHISYRVKAEQISVTDHHVFLLQDLVQRARLRLSGQLTLPESTYGLSDASILRALVLGDKSNLDSDTRQLYEDAGILHILSVSGLHVSLLGGAFLALAGLAHIPVRLRQLLTAGFVLLYWQLCGGSVSAGRAAVMFVCLCGASVIGRTYDSLSALALAGLLILWDSPRMLFQSGFQLSFAAVFGLQTVCPALSHHSSAQEKRQKNCSGSALRNRSASSLLSAVSPLLNHVAFALGLQLTLLPVTVWHFFRYPAYGLFLNLLILPLAPILVFLSAAGLLAGLLSLSVGRVFLTPACLILRLYEYLSRICVSLPGSSWLTGRPALWRIAVYYVVLALYCLYRQRGHRTKGCEDESPVRAHSRIPHPAPFLRLFSLPLLTVFLLSVLFLPPVSRPLTVTFLDVGQGDCAFLRTPQGTTLLIDAGSSDIKAVTEYRLTPFLEAQGVDKIDFVFLSHSDADHVNAVLQWLESGHTIGTAILPALTQTLAQDSAYRTLCEKLSSFQVSLLFFSEGQRFTEGALSLLCLAPAAPDSPQSALYTSANTASQVLLLEYEGFRILFTGDCGKEGEVLLTEALRQRNLSCQILKAGHHGSAASTGNALLNQLSADIVIVSCGVRNRYGHPHPDLLARLSERQIPCYVTADCGAVTFTIRSGKASLQTQLPIPPR